MIFSGSASAQVSPAVVAPVSVAVMSPADPGTLPSSPFYFLKEWRRSIQRAFSFGAEAKANTELKISEEKAAEIKATETTEPQNVTALTKALANYQESQARLKSHFEALKQTSDNPNIDKLIEKFTDAATRHEELFKSLIQKAGEKDSVKEAVSNSQSLIEDVAAVAATKSQAAAQAVQKIQERLRLSAGTPEEYCNRVQAKIVELDKLFSEGKIAEAAYNVQKKVLQDMKIGCPASAATSATIGGVAPAAVSLEDQMPQVPMNNLQAANDTPTANDIMKAIKELLPTFNLQKSNANVGTQTVSGNSTAKGSLNGNGVKANPMAQPTDKAGAVTPSSTGMGM